MSRSRGFRWVPRETFPPLERSRTLFRVDKQQVWSIVCFFVAKPYRRQGLMVKLLRGAVTYAASQGAQIVEGYPVDPPAGERVSGGTESYMGLASTFRKAGFVVAARPPEKRAIMRCACRLDRVTCLGREHPTQCETRKDSLAICQEATPWAITSARPSICRSTRQSPA